jgi:hypothetical protein
MHFQYWEYWYKCTSTYINKAAHMSLNYIGIDMLLKSCSLFICFMLKLIKWNAIVSIRYAFWWCSHLYELKGYSTVRKHQAALQRTQEVSTELCPVPGTHTQSLRSNFIFSFHLYTNIPFNSWFPAKTLDEVIFSYTCLIIFGYGSYPSWQMKVPIDSVNV